MMEHQDYIFFKLNDGLILNINHADYTDLVQRRATMPAFPYLYLKVLPFYMTIAHLDFRNSLHLIIDAAHRYPVCLYQKWQT